jgi:hypothetical protein
MIFPCHPLSRSLEKQIKENEELLFTKRKKKIGKNN